MTSANFYKPLCYIGDKTGLCTKEKFKCFQLLMHVDVKLSFSCEGNGRMSGDSLIMFGEYAQQSPSRKKHFVNK